MVKKEMMGNRRLPLEGIRVADFSWWAAGPVATRTMAHFGAQVIKVESEVHIDGLRVAQPRTSDVPGINVGAWHNNLNSGKLAITLNMDHPEARSIAERLIRVSDIVIDNFTPRVMERWGLTYKELVKIKPDLIVVNMPMQGLSGPHRDYLGFGLTIMALSGHDGLSGFHHRPPLGTGVNFSDYSCNPYHALVAILGALRYRNRTGKGQHIELSQVESTISVLDSAILEYTVNGRIPPRVGNRLANAAPHGCYRCRGDDRWCVIAVFSDEEWQAFCNVIGNPPWTKEERSDTLVDRKQNEDDLDRLIEEWTITRTREEMVMLMQQAGVAAGVVNDAEDLLIRDPQLKARDHYVYLDHPEAGRTAYDGITIKLSATPGEVRWPARTLGQDNEFVFKEIIGLSEEEINQYIVDGVIA